MLILCRKKNEEIMIGDQIVLTVIQIRGDKVRLGFKAPREVPIHREEVFRQLAAAESTDRQVNDPSAQGS